ncbi:MAG: thioesterase [Clostridiales bacterium]|nr:thioesterase [Clostridiales bacterium]
MYQWKDRVRFSELGEDKKMTLPAVMNVMQDCSNYQSDHLGIGADYLQKRNRAWLLSFWQVIIDRLPQANELYTAETRAWKFERFYGQRNFALYDEVGETMVRANSIWFFVDSGKMRPVRPEAEEIEPYGIDEPIDMPYAKGRKISLPESMNRETPIRVRHIQLDLNGHVNNGQYIRIAEEYFPRNEQIRELRAEYRTAAREGDWIYPMVGDTEDGWRVIALCQEDENPYAVVSVRV